MDRALIALALIVLAVAVALVIQRRRSDAPTQPTWSVPVQLDRSEFSRPDAPWLVAVFTSSTCDTCKGVWEKARLLDAGAKSEVVVQELEVTAARELHERYAIDAVPLILIADSEGIVRAHFLGPVTATDLWARVAELREPGTISGDCQSRAAES